LSPRNFYFVELSQKSEAVEDNSPYWARTEPEQARVANKPWNGVTITGHVEGRFLYSSALAKHILPFHLLAPADVILPVLREETGLRMTEPSELRADGYREMATWMSQVEEIWSA